MTPADRHPDHRRPAEPDLREVAARLAAEEETIRQGGGPEAIARQHAKGRKTARERIEALIDPDSPFLELGLWAGYQMYEEWGGAPAAGVVTGIGRVAGRRVAIVANDATVKAGAFFPMTIKKVLRAQAIAGENRLPLLYLVDSAGVFLPMQDEVFPDADDFGRIFRNNAVLSARGIPQIAAIMGNCVAGGAYLPVLCDTVLMTEGSGLYLAGPALVKAAIGQDVTSEELGARPCTRRSAGRSTSASRTTTPASPGSADWSRCSPQTRSRRPTGSRSIPRRVPLRRSPRSSAPTPRRSTTCAT